MLSAGNPFPNFALPNQDGKVTKLGDFAGQWLVVYFYPKDDTPGCTIQAKSFTATKADFDAAGVKVIGVLADTDSQLMKTLGLGQSEWKGMKFWERTSFVIDPNGIIRKVYEKVNADGHEKVLLDDIKSMKAKAA